ncbi:MAG: MerR family transcriptional regulator [Christensenellales bacterium]
MTTYKTAEVAAIMGIHPNTVRLYEKLKLIPKPGRLPNGYRVFTDLHLEHCRLVRIAFRIEVLQNGLRKKITKVVKVSATGDYDAAISLIDEYLWQIRQERKNAEEAIGIVKSLLKSSGKPGEKYLKRKEVSELLGISPDTIRNWEMNGLLTAKRRENGYRVYTDDDILRLKIIRTLRCANYSLEAILRLLGQLSENKDTDIGAALNTPGESGDIISVCDKLTVSLSAAERNALRIRAMLKNMKIRFL